MLINDSDAPIAITSGESTMATSIELHEMAMDGAMMRMRRVREFLVPARSRLELKPGGLHMMIFGLKQPLTIGDHLSITLHAADGQKISFALVVRAPDAAR